MFLARDSIYAIARYMPAPVRPSVRHMGGSVKDGWSRDLRIGRLRTNRMPNRIGRYDTNSNRISNRIGRNYKASSIVAIFGKAAGNRESTTISENDDK